MIECGDRVKLLVEKADAEGGQIAAGVGAMVIGLRGLDEVLLDIDAGQTYTGEKQRTWATIREVRKVARL